MKHGSAVLLFLPLLTLPWLAGCGLLDNNPNTIFTYEPCLFGCSKPTGPVPEGSSVTLAMGYADLRADVEVAARAVAEQPVDWIGVHAPTDGSLDAFLGAVAAHGLYFEIAASTVPYLGCDVHGRPREMRDLILAPAGSGAGMHEFWVGNPQSGLFGAREPGDDATPRSRGWASVDVDTASGQYRVLAARLDTTEPGLHAAWESELDHGPADTDRKVLRATGEAPMP